MIILFFAGAFCGLYINLYDIHVSRNIQKKKKPDPRMVSFLYLETGSGLEVLVQGTRNIL